MPVHIQRIHTFPGLCSHGVPGTPCEKKNGGIQSAPTKSAILPRYFYRLFQNQIDELYRYTVLTRSTRPRFTRVTYFTNLNSLECTNSEVIHGLFKYCGTRMEQGKRDFRKKELVRSIAQWSRTCNKVQQRSINFV